ncbi:ATP-binding protein [Streptomyces xanthochromogenes]|nr:ATP-binding protein [Streptomyces xanthochromogenes]
MSTPQAPSTRHEFTIPLPVRPKELSGIRRIVSAHLRYWRLEGLLDGACLIVTELVANAHQHAPGAGELTLRRVRGELSIIVSDESPDPPVLGQLDDAAESGRGMLLVDQIADRWWVERTAVGKRVHCTLALPSPDRALAPAQQLVACGAYLSSETPAW